MSTSRNATTPIVFLLFLFIVANVIAQPVPKVVVLSPHTEAIRVEFGKRFQSWHEVHYGSPAEVDWRDLGGTTDDLKFVMSEFSSKHDGINIDVFFGGGPEPYLLLKGKGLTEKYLAPAYVLSGIPQEVNGMEVYDRDGDWYGAAISSFGILQSTLVQRKMHLPFVKTWPELGDPKLQGWVGAGDPRNSGTMNTMFEVILQAYGWEKGWKIITSIGGNANRFDRYSSQTAKDVSLGETAYALAIDFYAFTQIAVAGPSNMTFVLPQDFTAINADGIAILKGAPNRLLAGHFMEFVLSEDGQKLWFLPKGYPGGPEKNSMERMSIRPDFYKKFKGISNIEFSPFELKSNFKYDSPLAGVRREVVAALIGAMVVDTHPELVKAWKKLIRNGQAESRLPELALPPISASEALALASGGWKKPEIRNKKRVEWQAFAQEKYHRIAAEPVLTR
ncbi:MAG: Phosphoglycerate transport regulatory protein PgtC [Verrucomicrobiales bacterium]|nr:Phosphoglycerate transport regulatory protein PgtC [Verrucomicrobiales bacterium]